MQASGTPQLVTPQFLTVDGVKTEIARAGQGKTLLLLHAVDGVKPASPYFQLLAQSFDVVAPSHPGFGHSEWPREFRTVEDLVYFHMTLADQLGISDAVLVGCSFGGWLAAEIAVRATKRFSHLVLTDAYGIKIGDRDSRDIADLYAISQEDMNRIAFHDPAKRKRDYSTMAEEDLVAIARSREAFAYFGWKPYLHNPSLRRWLRRIDIPTLVMWGESDGIVTPDYGRAYAAEIPGARFTLVKEAGHYPHIEQPETFARNIVEFAGAAAAPARKTA
jgi:pimeloyl-ACP methyl ester carboxylesterase